MAVALAGNLVSPARGLFIFCPLVVLSVVGVVVRWRAGELTAFWKALAVIPVVHWIVISAFKHWWGGDSYGPRFFTDLMPVLVVLALPAVEVLARWVAPSPRGTAPVNEPDTDEAPATARPAPTMAAGAGGPGRRRPGVERRRQGPGGHPALGVVLEQRAHRCGRPPLQLVELE